MRAVVLIAAALTLSACATQDTGSAAQRAYAAEAQACTRSGGTLVPTIGNMRQGQRCQALAAPDVYSPPLRSIQ